MAVSPAGSRQPRTTAPAVLKTSPEVVTMKKLILATAFAFGLASLGASAASACDGMKGQAKGDKSDQTGTQSNSSAKKENKGATKSDQKS
jgi:hypothetical protein